MFKGKSIAAMSRGVLACSSALYMFAGAAVVQAQDAPDAISELEEDAIVVTGSRIVRRDYNSESPIVTVSDELLQSTSEISIDQQLSKLPQFVAGANQTTNAGSSQASPTTSPGIATLNLRGLGSNRTLVLLDGRRTQPADASLVVDINTIPAAALDGVEVITGGAGSTYGADAVAGVVNFKLKKNFNGLDIDAQYGVADAGDNDSYKVSALVGSDFADGRGNAMFGVSYAERKEVNIADRDFFAAEFTDPNTPSGSNFLDYRGYNPFIFQQSPVIDTSARLNAPSTAVGEAILGLDPGDVGSRDYYFFNPAGTVAGSTLFQSIPGAVSHTVAPGFTGDLNSPTVKLQNVRDANGNIISQELRTINRGGYLSLPMERYSMFGHAYYDISDDLTAYVQGNFNQNETRTDTGRYAPSFLQWGVTVPRDAAHPIPEELATLLDSRPNQDGAWGLVQPLDFLGTTGIDTTSYTYEVLVGLRGNLPFGDWTFDAFASHGKSSQTRRFRGFGDAARLQAVINAPNYGANSVFLNTQLGINGSCTSGLNPFTNPTVSQDCKDIVSANLVSLSDLEQDQAELNIQGTVMELPAGPLQMALGAGFRENGFTFEPDSENSSNTIDSFTIGLFGVKGSSGTTRVKEVYGEVLVPILADQPFFQDLSLNAGLRMSDYNTAGTVWTWKVNGNWEVNDFLTFRGGYQVANRAPNVAELFQPGVFQTVPWSEYDPCSRHGPAYGNVASNPDQAEVIALCNQLTGVVGSPINPNFNGNFSFNFGLGRDEQIGNATLKPEEATTWTVGTVIRTPEPTALGNFTLSLDYYNIRVDGAIAPATTQFVYQQCFNSDGASNSSYDVNNPFCQLIIRLPNGNWASTTAKFLNLGGLATAGIDAQLDWNIDAPGLGGETGTIFANVNFNYLDKYEVQTTPTSPVVDFSNTVGAGIDTAPYGAQFRWRLFTNLGWDFGPGSISLNWRHLPGAHHSSYASNVNTEFEDVGAYDIFGLSARYQINDVLEFRGGVDNLFNREPNRVGVDQVGSSQTLAAGSTDSGSYDVLGRRYYFGIKASF